MQQSFSLLDSFASISGLRINYEKTEALWIGTMRFQRRKIAAYQNISWPSHKVKALGVWLSTIKEEATTLNYEEKKETISKTIENWQFRRLTLLGKIVVIKSLLASQLVYIMSPLPTSSEHLRDINNLLYQFLWDGKRDKIKRAEMINDYATGGLKMLDIQTFNRALKAKWIQKYLDSRNKGKWKLFLDFFLAKYNANLLITGNLNVADAASLEIDDPFTKELKFGRVLISKDSPLIFLVYQSGITLSCELIISLFTIKAGIRREFFFKTTYLMKISIF